MFNELKEYKERHGHTKVPIGYKVNKRLGLWVKHQRSNKKKMTLRADRFEKLNSIDFVWRIRNYPDYTTDKLEKEWMKKLIEE